jgi:nucleoid-associated protein YgaU
VTGLEMLAAAALGLLLAVAVLLMLGARRVRARRLAADEAARRAEADLALDRLAWLTGRSERSPVTPHRPAGPLVRARHVGPLTEQAISPRRRLWRDASAVLLVGLVGVLIAGNLLPATPLDGGVLQATATPRPTPSPAATAPSAPSPDPPGPPAEPSPAAPPGGSPRETPSPTSLVHVVVRGDTLSSISLAYGTTIDEILAANPQIADPNLIVVGQAIVIPPPGASPAP